MKSKSRIVTRSFSLPSFAANLALFCALASTVLALAGCSQFDARATSSSENAIADSTVPADYIVVLSKPAIEEMNAQFTASGFDVSAQAVVTSAMRTLSDDYDLSDASKTFSHAIRGGVFELDGEEAAALRKDPRVAYVERDGRVSISDFHTTATQAVAPWGLDRLDQSSLPLSKTYESPDGGAAVNAYVIDTGVLKTHTEFQGRASFGYDFVDNDNDATDCNGHGTHVAGTIAGATYGVAKNANIIAVRVLDCNGSGSFSGVVQGIEWVTAHHTGPSVANMSLGGGVSQAIDDAVAASIQSGVTYVVAAGNENQNACNSSPSRVPAAITVGATTNTDARASFSNFGSCVDVFAPGQDITSSWFTSATATNTISGTSMASPHVAGVAALYLAQHPSALPAEVSSKIATNALSGKISNAGTGSPNLLANISFLLTGITPPGPTPPPNPTPVPNEPGVTTLKNGVAQTAIAAAKGGEKFYVITVPAGTAKLTIDISGGTGDADLYTKSGSKPTATSYDCRPYKYGNTETCSVTSPKAGKYYVRLNAYAAYSGVQLTAKF
ncbi:S8 family peptidase [soil metagenome]